MTSVELSVQLSNVSAVTHVAITTTFKLKELKRYKVKVITQKNTQSWLIKVNNLDFFYSATELC